LLDIAAMSRVLRRDDRPIASEPPVPEQARWTPADAAHRVLRVGAGLLFLCHGLQKLFGLFGGISGGAVPLASRFGVAGVLEVAGGLLLVLGFFTRPVALVLAGEMIVAYVTAHLPRGAVPLRNGGEVALLYALIFVFFALTPRSDD
jgi:putative oxidoreductase